MNRVDFLLHVHLGLEHACKSWLFSHPYAPKALERSECHTRPATNELQNCDETCDIPLASVSLLLLLLASLPSEHCSHEDDGGNAVHSEGQVECQLRERQIARPTLAQHWGIFVLGRKANTPGHTPAPGLADVPV